MSLYRDDLRFDDPELRQRLFDAPVDMSSVRSVSDSRADERARWDADDRFSHYLANLHLHRGGSNV